MHTHSPKERAKALPRPLCFCPFFALAAHHIYPRRCPELGAFRPFLLRCSTQASPWAERRPSIRYMRIIISVRIDRNRLPFGGMGVKKCEMRVVFQKLCLPLRKILLILIYYEQTFINFTGTAPLRPNSVGRPH